MKLDLYLEKIQNNLSDLTLVEKDLNELKPEEIRMYAENVRYTESKSKFPKKKTIPDNILLQVLKKDKNLIKDIKFFIFKTKDDIPVGFNIASICKKSIGYIWGMYIEPEYRRGDMAKILFRKANIWLKNNNVKSIDIVIKGGNEGAVSFYTGMGFDIKKYHLSNVSYKDGNGFVTPHNVNY